MDRQAGQLFAGAVIAEDLKALRVRELSCEGSVIIVEHPYWPMPLRLFFECFGFGQGM